ncbi:uncharacterized protein LOC119740774 [Patiria miniata]|uniref:Uncharacterized protein n=1 Tax=Patiria miniata TaxID=46514 RepID=A0A914B7H6_PATMI|nr:uncharacterized protein LOC119740774 [Patiria miniata]
MPGSLAPDHNFTAFQPSMAPYHAGIHNLYHETSPTLGTNPTPTQVSASTARVSDFSEPPTFNSSSQMMLSSMLAASAGGINTEVPNFGGGDPAEFRCFEAMIDGCIKPLVHLSELQKYFIVRSKLSGQPKKDVLGLEHDGSPFTKAMSTLKKLYGDVGVLIRAKIDQITSWPRLTASDSKGMVEFAAAVSALVKQLKSAPEGQAELNANSTACILYSRLSHTHQTAFLKAMKARNVNNFSLLDIDMWLQDTAAIARKKVQLSESIKVELPPTNRDRRRKGAAAYHMELAGKTTSNPPKGASAYKATRSEGKKPFRKSCPHCREEHWLSRCDKFSDLTMEQRMKWIKADKRCWQCARLHKNGKECDLRKPCRRCDKMHLTVLHDLIEQPGYGVYYSSFDPNLSVFYGDGNPWLPDVSMKILPVTLYANGRQLETYCLLDDAANFSLMLSEASEALGLKGESTKMPIATAREECTPCKGVIVSVDLAHIHDQDSRITISNVFSSSMLRLSEHSVPARDLQRRWPHLRGLPLQEVKEARPLLLIGSDRPDLIVPIESHFGPEGAPVAVRTKLAWAVQGPILKSRRKNEVNFLSVLPPMEADRVLHENVCKMWQHDAQMYLDRKQATRSKQDQRAIDLLEAKSTYVNVDGIDRVATPLLWRRDNEVLTCPASAVSPALKRNEQRLQRDPALAVEHSKKIRELKEAGLVRMLTAEEKERNPERHWYIPHHVVRQNGKTRLVFNCAFPYRGESLNDHLLPGPTLGSPLVGVLVRFRQHQVAVSGDIKAMFHCVRTLECDRCMLRFLWRDLDPDAEMEELEWNVLPFGTTCSPCCATFALHKHVQDRFPDPDIVRSVMNSFYVDNCLDGKSSVLEAKALVGKLCQALGAGGFPIVKWASNFAEVVKDLPQEARSCSTERWLSSSCDSPEEAALGPHWNFQHDTLRYKLELREWPVLTRRAVLSDVMRCAGKDPLGYPMPYMVRGKMLVQELWKRPWGLDEEIPDEGRMAYVPNT